MPNPANMVDWKREVTELWVLRMSDSQYLRNLVESMPRRLEDVTSTAGREPIPSTSQYSSTPNWPFSGPKLCQKRDSYLNLYVWCQFICRAL